jgi:hypothetical protein
MVAAGIGFEHAGSAAKPSPLTKPIVIAAQTTHLFAEKPLNRWAKDKKMAA